MSCGTSEVSAQRHSKKLDLLIEQGATFEIPIVYKEDNQPVDLTGATVKAQFRERISSADPVISLDNGVDGGLVVTPLDGKIVMTILPEQTETLKVYKGVWDMLITFADGTKFRILQGNWTLDRGVTR